MPRDRGVLVAVAEAPIRLMVDMVVQIHHLRELDKEAELP